MLGTCYQCIHDLLPVCQLYWCLQTRCWKYVSLQQSLKQQTFLHSKRVQHHELMTAQNDPSTLRCQPVYESEARWLCPSPGWEALKLQPYCRHAAGKGLWGFGWRACHLLLGLCREELVQQLLVGGQSFAFLTLGGDRTLQFETLSRGRLACMAFLFYPAKLDPVENTWDQRLL